MFGFRPRCPLSIFRPRNKRGRLVFLLAGLLALGAPMPGRGDAFLERELKAGSQALDADKFDAAIKHFDQALKLLNRPDQPAPAEHLAIAYFNRANAHYGAEHWKLAVDDFNRYIEIVPDDAEAYSLRGVARKATGDYDGLMADEKKAAELDPQYQYLVDAAESTILRRRGLLALWVLGCLVVAAGAIPFVKAIIRVSQAERQNA